MPTVPTPSITSRSPRVRTYAPSRGEAAFTLIELIVAAVLLAIVLAVGTTGILGALGGGSGSMSSAATDAAMARASNLFQDDIQRAATADRRDNLLRDPEIFERAVQNNTDAHSSDQSDPRRLNLDDVVTAEDDVVQVEADVHPNAGVECVTWEAAASPTRFMVTRSVGTGCGNAAFQNLESSIMFTSRPDALGTVNQTPFRYRLLCNRSTCPTAPAGVNCRPWMDATPQNRQLRWIVAVEAQFSSVSTDRAAKSASSLARATIRSRESDTYRRALGC